MKRHYTHENRDIRREPSRISIFSKRQVEAQIRSQQQPDIYMNPSDQESRIPSPHKNT